MLAYAIHVSSWRWDYWMSIIMLGVAKITTGAVYLGCMVTVVYLQLSLGCSTTGHLLLGRYVTKKKMLRVYKYPNLIGTKIMRSGDPDLIYGAFDALKIIVMRL